MDNKLFLFSDRNVALESLRSAFTVDGRRHNSMRATLLSFAHFFASSAKNLKAGRSSFTLSREADNSDSIVLLFYTGSVIRSEFFLKGIVLNTASMGLPTVGALVLLTLLLVDTQRSVVRNFV